MSIGAIVTVTPRRLSPDALPGPCRHSGGRAIISWLARIALPTRGIGFQPVGQTRQVSCLSHDPG